MTCLTIPFCLGLLMTLSTSLAQTPYQTQGLTAHNTYRAKHQNTPPMTLSSDLDTRADTCAQYYALVVKGIDHSCTVKNGSGENLYWSSGSSLTTAGIVQKAVDGWYGEIKNYNYSNPGFTSGTGHFTQVVWASSINLGIGSYYDSNSTRTYVVGLYSPAGNYKGQYSQNVLPLI